MKFYNFLIKKANKIIKATSTRINKCVKLNYCKQFMAKHTLN